MAPWYWKVSPSGWPNTRRIDRLRPKPYDVTACRSALAKVVRVVHNAFRRRTDLTVDRVTTCGSVGKKTASKHSYDLDLVVYFSDLDPSDIESEISSILDTIQDAMDAQYPGTRDPDWYRKFGLNYTIANMDIDILVGACGVVPKDFLAIDDVEQRSFMSSSVSHLSTRFMKRHALFFKDLVRIVKDWRDSFTWNRHSKPKSYLIEILLLDACRKCKVYWSNAHNKVVTVEPYHARLMTRVLLKFFELVSGVERYDPDEWYDVETVKLFVWFDTYYSLDDLPLSTREPLFESTHGRSKRIATAVVLDPVNPTNNLWLTLGDPNVFIERASAACMMIRAQTH